MAHLSSNVSRKQGGDGVVGERQVDRRWKWKPSGRRGDWTVAGWHAAPLFSPGGQVASWLGGAAGSPSRRAQVAPRPPLLPRAGARFIYLFVSSPPPVPSARRRGAGWSGGRRPSFSASPGRGWQLGAAHRPLPHAPPVQARPGRPARVSLGLFEPCTALTCHPHEKWSITGWSLVVDSSRQSNDL